MTCSACDGTAVTTLAYAGRALCRDHFTRLVERRFKQALREQLAALDLGGGARIGVGLSGGKDSAALTALLCRAIGQDPRFSVVAITVDEGIPGYRDVSIQNARALVEQLDVELEIVSHREDHGTTTQAVAEQAPGEKPCRACGVMRRSSLNQAARRLGCDVLATGHNLDDHAETTLMNLMRGDVDQVLRTAPHARTLEGLIPRITPLIASTEREVALYAVLRELPFHGAECPHSVDATRRTYRAVILDLLDQDPSVRHRLAALATELKERIPPGDSADLHRCQACGEPCTGERCRACELTAQIQS